MAPGQDTWEPVPILTLSAIADVYQEMGEAPEGEAWAFAARITLRPYHGPNTKQLNWHFYDESKLAMNMGAEWSNVPGPVYAEMTGQVSGNHRMYPSPTAAFTDFARAVVKARAKGFDVERWARRVEQRPTEAKPADDTGAVDPAVEGDKGSP